MEFIDGFLLLLIKLSATTAFVFISTVFSFIVWEMYKGMKDGK